MMPWFMKPGSGLMRIWPLPVSVTLGTITFLTTPAFTHEAWLLEPRQMFELFEQPLSSVWHDVTMLSMVTASVLLVGLALAEYLDRRFQPLEQTLDRRYQEPARHWALLILRITLGILMIAAALGLNPRYGTSLFSEPTLFVPDLELSAVTNLVPAISGLELIVGVALVLGIYVNFSALLVVLLVAMGFFWFGPQIMFAYAGHILAPAFVLLVEDRDRFEHVTPRDSWPEQLVQRLLPFMTLERNLILVRVVTGLTFIYLAVMDKYLHSPQLEQIIASHEMPTFGIPPSTLVFLMAAIELACGFALVVGIAERIVAAVMIGAMLFFALVLGESPLIHANIFGILIAIILLGPGYMHRDRKVAPASERWGLAAMRVSGAAVLCAIIASSGLWVTDLRAAVPAADARLVHAGGAPDMQPKLSGALVEPLGNGFYRIKVNTRNFAFALEPSPLLEGVFQGHAHVYAGKEKLITLYAPEGIFGPVPTGTTSVLISLMNPNHCYIATDEGLLAKEVELPSDT